MHAPHVNNYTYSGFFFSFFLHFWVSLLSSHTKYVDWAPTFTLMAPNFTPLCRSSTPTFLISADTMWRILPPTCVKTTGLGSFTGQSMINHLTRRVARVGWRANISLSRRIISDPNTPDDGQTLPHGRRQMSWSGHSLNGIEEEKVMPQPERQVKRSNGSPEISATGCKQEAWYMENWKLILNIYTHLYTYLPPADLICSGGGRNKGQYAFAAQAHMPLLYLQFCKTQKNIPIHTTHFSFQLKCTLVAVKHQQLLFLYTNYDYRADYWLIQLISVQFLA